MKKLIVYRAIYYDKILSLLDSIINGQDNNENDRLYYELCYLLCKANVMDIKEYIYNLIINDENIFSLLAEKENKINEKVKKAVIQDIKILKKVINYDYKKLAHDCGDASLFLYDGKKETLYYKGIFLKTEQEIYDFLYDEYSKKGAGLFRNLGFTVIESNKLLPTKNFNPKSYDYIYGYNRQKEQIVNNVSNFVSAKPALNTLLFGDRGTGKSAAIKALIPLFGHKSKLRLIQVKKDNLKAIPYLLDILSNRGLYFIIFIDDLSFENDDKDYKLLKSAIEGGTNERSNNIIFCITTNRRNLIKDNTVERQNDVSINDHLNETAALSDRFGLKLFYARPKREEFEDMVYNISKDMKVQLSENYKSEAVQYAQFNGGFSGRNAVQFITSKLNTDE